MYSCGLLCGMNTAGLKLVVVYSSEKLVPIYQTTRCRNSEDNNANLRFCKNTKSWRRRSRRERTHVTQQKVTLVIYCTNFFPLFIEISLAKSLILRKRGMLKSVVGYVCICMHTRLCDQCLWFTLTYRNPSCCVKGCVVSGSRRSRHVCGRSHLPSLVRPPPPHPTSTPPFSHPRGAALINCEHLFSEQWSHIVSGTSGGQIE
jgi:hypothetical protein